ncbi:hypothetical protein SLEP1_g46380 [Rubroshorea leprosula]|uniref:Uncharacterized protein n=1 Tax=Rubroshorea leprosula TaxID=152421 RepID=A0AAV5LLZ7_9ROSI|nr:hypothetical protein SLEP1_g46380 [Rubroshorea leprosula]
MDGNSISFWKDCWLFDIPLNSILVGPLSRSDEDLQVADVFSCADFNSSLISYPLPDTILETIKANPISKIGLGNDSYSWKGSRDGSFSMKVAYLMAKGVNPNPVMNWNWIWKIHTLPKIQCFIWLLCYERLKTLDLLSRLGIVESNVCPMCLVAKETCDHLCRECPSSSFIWHTFFSQGTVGSSNSLFQWIKDNCLSKNMCPTIPIPWGTVFSFILWSIWLQRNNKLYSSNVFEPNYIISIIWDKVFEFYSASPLPSPKNTQKESRLVCWEKPPEGYCKLNTDGSAHGNPGLASAGGVIRDHMGRWIVGFACKIGYASCLRAELWGIREGLLLAYQRNIQNLIVGVDSFVATQLLSCCFSPHHPLYSLILDCREILSRIPRTRIQHVYREANQCADALTAVAHSLPVDFVSFDCSPPGLLLYYEADMRGTYRQIDPTIVHPSIALLQERFKQLERAKEMRQEKELLRMFPESRQINAAMPYVPCRSLFHPVLTLQSELPLQCTLKREASL